MDKMRRTKIFAVIAALCLCMLTAVTVNAQATETEQSFDVNGDGKNNISDAAVIQLWLAKLYSGYFNEAAADTDGDGYITIKDASYIQMCLAGLLEAGEAYKKEVTLPSYIAFDSRDSVITVGNNSQLSFSSDGEGFEYTYSSDNEEIAEIDENGVVTAKKSGAATISVTTENGVSDRCFIYTAYNDECVASVNDSRELFKGESLNLADLLPDEKVNIIFTGSTDEETAYADKSGAVTAAGAGTAEIHAVALSDTNRVYQIVCNLTVQEAVEADYSVSLGVGEIYSLNAYSLKIDSPEFISCVSSDPTVASADAEGNIKANKAGAASVTGIVKDSADGTAYSYNCTVTVCKAATSLALSKTSITMGVGEAYTLTGQVNSGSAAYFRTYASSNSKVASVDSSTGVITAKAVGSACVTCTLKNGVKAACTVTVKKLAASITLNKTKLTLGAGETFDLNSSIPENTAAYFRVYSSSNPDIASVERGGGLVTAKTAGSATVTCTMYNGLKATCTVTVKAAPKSVTISPSSLTLKVGQTSSLTAAGNSGSYSNMYTWSSSNTQVLKISTSDGKATVSAMKLGTATVTATAFNGVKATLKVTVKGSAVKAIDISEWQGTVDFKKVKAAGYDYVILRAGYGRETYQKDGSFETYYKNAKAAGLKIGAYWYSYADSATDAKKEAQTCLKCISGKTFNLPVYYDLEDSSMTHLGKTTLTNIALKFCETIEASGYKAGVYANTDWYKNYLDKSKISAKYSTWLAKIDGDFSAVTDDLHQYSWNGKVNGISVDVDLDYIYNLNIVK